MRIARTAVILTATGSLLGGLSAAAVAAPPTSKVSINASIDKTGRATVTVRYSGFNFGTIYVSATGSATLTSLQATDEGKGTVYFCSVFKTDPKGDVTFTAVTPTGLTDSKTITTSWSGFSPCI